MNSTPPLSPGRLRAAHADSAAWALPLILLAYLVIAIAMSLIIPLGEAADEVSHRAYVGEIAVHGRLPSASGPASGEAFQPPLYYILVAALTAWAPQQDVVVLANPDASLEPGGAPNLLLHPASEVYPFSSNALAWHLMRLVSVALGALNIWATYHLAGAAFPADPNVARGAAAFVAFLPGFLVVSSAVSNDNLIVALSALSVWQLVRVARQQLSMRDAAVLGALLGLAALTKLSGLLYWGVTAVMLAWLAREPGSRRRLARVAATAFIVAFAITLPFLVRNLLLDGDVLAYARMLDVTPRLTAMTAGAWQQYAVSLYTSIWGRFGGASHHWLPAGVYVLLGLVPVLATIGLLRGASASGSGSLPATERRLCIFFLFIGGVVLASHMRLTVVLAGQDLTRQLFPALPPIAAVVALRISMVTRNSRVALTALALGMAVYAVFFVAFVASTYAAHPQSAGLLLPAQGQQAADFGGELRLVDYRIENQTVAPGDDIGVSASFQALSRPADVYWLLLRFVGPQGTVATRDGLPANGHPTTDLWQPNQTFVSHHVLTVPATVPPGVYRLELGVHHMGRWEWLPVHGQDTMLLGEVRVQ